MKISLNWLKKFVKVPVADKELIRLIGARLVEVEGVIDETHKYDDIYIVRVERAEKIPDTHLTLCQINVGDLSTGDGSGRRPQNVLQSKNFGEGEGLAGPIENLVQVVCGASNVREGMLAVWIAPGAIVPASVHEDASFVIGKRKMLGKYESNGMLAGADELDFGDDHSGIVEINPLIAKPGDLLADVFELRDLILEIENKSLTHRPDTFGMIGFAREVAGILGIKFFEQNSNQDMLQKKQVLENLHINISDNGICKRYSAVVLEKHGELKKKYLTWQDTILAKSGMRPIEPIVDATNYLMLLTGQPLHAFDYDKFVEVGKDSEARIGVRLAKNGEKLVLIDDKEVVLNGNDIVITSNDRPVALAGAMGGKTTEITAGTKRIIIEAATFSLYNLRRTQMAHGIFTEAITRFTKGQPAYQTLTVARMCADLLADGFRVTSEGDEYPTLEKEIVVKITINEINNLLGTKYSKRLIEKTLENVGFRITSAEDLPEVTTEDEGASPVTTGASDPCPKQMVIEILVPAWRTDIHIKEDIIEEVGRLLGYDNIEPTLPLHRTANKNQMLELKRNVRELLSRYGANEVLTYSFVSEKLLRKAGQNPKDSYKIVNSISPDLQYVRQSIVPSLLEKTYLNEKLPVEKFAIFEMNKVYRKSLGENEEKVPNEKMSLGLVVAERKNKETAFYKAKKYAAKLLEELNISAEFLPIKGKNAECEPFEIKRTAGIFVDGKYIGIVGEFKNSVRNEFKLAPYLAGFEVDLDLILENFTEIKKIEFRKKKVEDLTVSTTKSYAEVLKEVETKYPNAKITPLSIYQPDGAKEKNISFHIELML